MSEKYRWLGIVIGVLLLSLACGGGDRGLTTEAPQATLESKIEPIETLEEEEEPFEDEETALPTSTRESAEPSSEISEEGASLEIINESGVVVQELYVSPVDATTWGENWLQAPLDTGENIVLEEIAPASYDLLVANADDKNVEALYNVPLNAGEQSWTIIGSAGIPEDVELHFEDDFNDNRNSWGGSDQESVHYMTPTGGEYCILFRDEQNTAWEWYEPLDFTNFLAEVKCTVDPSTDASCGLGYGPDADNLLWYEIDAGTQSYALFLLEDDEWQEAPIEWSGAYHIDPTGVNYLALERWDDVISLYVNGTLIDQLTFSSFVDQPTLSTFAEGRIAIGGAAYDDPNVTVCLDDLHIWRPVTGASGTSTEEPPTAPTEESAAPTEESGAPAGQSPLKINWGDQMGYEGREGESRWCEMQMTYQNVSGAPINWPDYQPGFLIRNGDDSEDGWYNANFYRKEDGWAQGIEGDPQPIQSGGRADWTWYSYTDRADQYCAEVAVEYQGWVYHAFYNAQGTLVDSQVYAP